MPNVTLKRWDGNAWVELLPTPSSHTHGNISNLGIATNTDFTPGNNVKLVVTDSSNAIGKSSIAFSATGTNFLKEDGTWAAPVNDGRYYTETEIDLFLNRGYSSQVRAATLNLPVGWYTIATNTGDRAIARFGLRDRASGAHQAVVFYAAHHFGTDPSNTITVLHSSHYITSPYRYIRIKDNGTYDGAALQVYIDSNTNTLDFFILGDNFQDAGWVLKNWIPDATDPGDLDNWASFTTKAQVDLDQIAQGGIVTTGPIYADGDTTQYRVLTTNDEGSGNGLDADTLDGQHESYFINTSATTQTKSGSLTLGGTLTVPDFGRAVVSTIPANSFFTTDTSQIAQAPFGGVLWHDLWAFNRLATPTFETSNDGTTYTSATLNNNLFAMKENQAITVINASGGQKSARWTWNGMSWSTGRWLVIGHTYTFPTPNITVLVERSADAVTWTTIHTSTRSAGAQPAWYIVSDYAGDLYVRLTITHNSGSNVAISSIRLLSSRWGDQGRGKEWESPWDWDGSRNISTPGNITGNVLRAWNGATTTFPAFSFNTDTNTGIYSPAEDTIGFVEGGVESMRLDSSGRLGLGTTSPSSKLEIVNPGNTKTDIKFLQTGVNSTEMGSKANDQNFYITNTTAGSTTLGDATTSITLTSTGRFGVGTSSPLNRFQVNITGADSNDGILVTRDDTTTVANEIIGGIGFDSTDGNVPSSILEASAYIAAFAAEDHSVGDKGGYLTFGTAPIDQDDDTVSLERMRIDASGNVGIGTTTPGTRLNIAQATEVGLRLDSGSYTGFLGLSGANGTWATNSLAGDVVLRAETGNFLFSSSVTERFRITAGGLVGINETSPSAQLQVKSGATTRVPLIVDTLALQTANLAEFKSNTATKLVVTKDGKLQAGSGDGEIHITTSGVRIETLADNAFTPLTVNKDDTNTSARLQEWQLATNTVAYVDETGELYTPALASINGSNYATFNIQSSPTLTRNINDAAATLTVNNANASSTGNLLNLQAAGSNIISFKKDGTLLAPATFTIDPSTHGDVTGKVIILGDLQVDGTTTTINSTNLDVDDKLITVSKGAANKAASDGGGLAIDLGTDGSASLTYGSTADAFTFNKPLNVSGALSASDVRITNSAVGVNPLIVNAVASTTARLQDWSINNSLRATIANNGRLATVAGVSNLDSINNSLIETLIAGTTISRNVSDANPALIVNQVHASSTGDILKVQAGGTDRLTVKQGGNVGIGTTAPGVKFEVVGDHVSGQGIARFTGNTHAIATYNAATGYQSGFHFNTAGTPKWYVDNMNTDASDRFEIASRVGGDNVRFSILQNGNVGIGTTNPLAPLQIATPDATAYQRALKVGNGSLTNNSGAFIEFSSSTTDTLGSRIGGGREGASGASFLRFDTNINDIAGSSERMRITSGGNIGIGTTTPTEKLDVSGTVKATSLKINDTHFQDTATVTTTSTTQTVLATYAVATYATGKFLIQATSGGNRHVSELLVTHNGTVSTATEYAILKTSGNLYTVTTDISGGNVRILVTSTSATSTVYRTTFTLIGV